MSTDNPIQQKSYDRMVVAITSLYTIVQLVCLWIYGYTPYPDSEGYILLAEECVASGTFYPMNLTDIPFLWNIGAINAVVLSLYLFHSVVPLLVVYTLMQGIMAWLVFAIARELFDGKVALVSLLLFVLYPANYGCGTSVLSEVPFMFFSLCALSLVLKGHLALGGISFAVANYFRPMAIVFIVAVVFYMIYKRLKAGRYICLLAGYLIVTCSIGTVNYVIKGRYFTQGAMGWMGLMQYSWDHDSDKADDWPLFGDNDPNVIDDKLNYDCLQRDSVWRSHFLLWLSNNKCEYLKQMPEKVLKTYVSDNVNFCAFLPDKENREYMYEEISLPFIVKSFPNWTSVQVLTVINLIYYYLLLLLALMGAICALRHGCLGEMIIPVMTVVAGTALLMLVGHGEARFHQPFMPMFIILAANLFMKQPSRRVTGRL